MIRLKTQKKGATKEKIVSVDIMICELYTF